MAQNAISLGVPELDKIFPTPPRRGSLILIEGDPGSGKTTLASMIIYNNIVRKKAKAVYISFYETKDVFYNNMRRLGMDFEALEEKRLFQFIDMISIASKQLVEYFSDTYARLLTEFKPDWIVIDSITPLLEVLQQPAQRAFLRNTLYLTPGNQPVNRIIIAETIRGRGFHGGLEYVSDIVLRLEKKLVAGQVHRIMTIAKSRGTEPYVHMVPFTITDGVGLRFLVYPHVDRIPSPDISRIYYTGCRVFDSAVGGVPRGSQILFLYPSGFAVDELFIKIALRYAMNYNLKTLLITYSTPAELLSEKIRGYVPKDFHLKYLKIRGINPLQRSLTDILVWGLEEIEKNSPDLLILHGLRNIYEIYSMNDLLYNQAYRATLLYRLYYITTIRIMAVKEPGEYHPAREYSDIVLEASQTGGESFMVRVLRAGYHGKPGSILDSIQFQSCVSRRIR